MGSLNGLIQRARTELGYIEKASNSNLDSKTGNKGTANYTKYSRDINSLGLMGCQAQPWCGTHQFWLEVQEFGIDVALKHFHMSKNTYVGYNVFATKAKFPASKRSKTPKLGCLVVFSHSHIGRVVSISGNTITTIEGNTSPKSYDRNGGMVAQKTYNINDNKIDCFLIIDYEFNESTEPSNTYTVKKGDTLSKIAQTWGVSLSSVAAYNDISNPNIINVGQVIRKPGNNTPSEAPSSPAPSVNSIIRDGQIHANNFCGAGIATDGVRGTDTKKAGIKALQTAMNLDYGVRLAVDGIWGAKSEAALKGHTVRLGETQYMITALQILLMLKGYDPNGLENPGHFGSGCESTVLKYQKDKGLSADKIAGYNTFKSLIA